MNVHRETVQSKEIRSGCCFLIKTGNVKRARNVEGYERVAKGCSKKENSQESIEG